MSDEKEIRVYSVRASYLKPGEVYRRNVTRNVIADGIDEALLKFRAELAEANDLKIWQVHYLCNIDIF